MTLEIFSVGGALRDALLGQSVKDLDWVVVGATPQEMKAQGFQTVGKDFPVFLHPRTHEEYALARTERKPRRATKVLWRTLHPKSRFKKIWRAAT